MTSVNDLNIILFVSPWYEFDTRHSIYGHSVHEIIKSISDPSPFTVS